MKRIIGLLVVFILVIGVFIIFRSSPENTSVQPEEEATNHLLDEFVLEFHTDETSKDVAWGSKLNYTVKEVISSSLPELQSNMKHITLDYTFEILDNAIYEMQPQNHFSILVGEDSYQPIEVTILEAQAWEEERFLEGGKMRALLEFIVPENTENYGLLFNNEDKNLGKGIMVWFDKPYLADLQPNERIYFEEMLLAVKENDDENFMSYHDHTNELFYKEQKVWLWGIHKKKQEGWDIAVLINNVTLESEDKGSITLQINMKYDEQNVSNHLTFPINKIDDNWIINDLPFKKITEGPINLYYLPSLEKNAAKVLTDAKEIVELYNKTFDWNPSELNIKLYDSVEGISASAAWPMLYGVAVPFTSLKFVVQGNYEVIYGYMKHEIVHMMLADITNNNAPAFMQEGLAIFISSTLIKDDSGKLQLDLCNATEREKVVLENSKEIKPIADLKDINYTKNSIDIYNTGFLITNYLIHTFGMEKYLDMVEILKNHNIIDSYQPEREQIVYNRAIDALEQTYGPLNKLSEEYIEFYNNRK